MIRIVALLALLLASGCAHKMAVCRGPVFPLNAGQWDPTPQDLSK